MRLASPLVIAGLFVAGAAHAQVPDTTLADTGAFALPPIEVVGTIRPDAGPTVGSGVPARVTTLEAEDVDAYEPRVLSDAPTSSTSRPAASTPPPSSASLRASRCSSTGCG